jgi:putative aminopeptidase FrvX
MLKELCELSGVSSQEDKVRDFIRQNIQDNVQEIIEDPYGNLIARKGPVTKPKLMLAAHMDEVGFMIMHIEKNGLLKFKPIGIAVQTLLAKRVVIGKDRIPGVIGAKPVHLIQEDEAKKWPEIKNLFIDIGAASKEAASKLVEIGDCGTFDTAYRENGDTMYGKAFDNRLGCFMLIDLIRTQSLPGYYVFSVQEEMGLRGAQIAGFRVAPDVALAVDTTGSVEWPTDQDVPSAPAIGGGPVITVSDLRVICDRRLVNLLTETAQQHGISYQVKKPGVGGTDAGPIHLVRSGVPTAVLSLPARYIHSPLSMASRNDLSLGIKLLTLTVEKILSAPGIYAAS